jgi:putative membrane protein
MNLKKMILNTLAVVIIVTVSVTTLHAQIESYNNNQQDTSPTNQRDTSYNFFGDAGYSDAAFVAKNIEDSRNEIDLAKMAIERSSNENVKSIAQAMIDDNSKMLQHLEKINNGAAASDNQEIESINEPNENSINEQNENSQPASPLALNDATGEQFDSIWIKQMLDGQKIKLGELHQARKATADPVIKSLVKEAIPLTRKHRDRLEDIKTPEVTSMNGQ